MLLSWFLFPLLLLTLSAGCGLLVNRAADGLLPPALVAPVGFTVVVLVGEMTSIASGLAELAAPLTVTLAVAGFLLSRSSRRRALERYAALAALAVFVVYAAPIVFSGDPTFAGYVKLDDTATWLALTDRIAEAGRDLSNLPPSTYEATLHFNLGSGYPIGAFTPLPSRPPHPRHLPITTAAAATRWSPSRRWRRARRSSLVIPPGSSSLTWRLWRRCWRSASTS